MHEGSRWMNGWTDALRWKTTVSDTVKLEGIMLRPREVAWVRFERSKSYLGGLI